MTRSSQQNLISLALIALSFLMVWLISPPLDYQPAGLAYSFQPDRQVVAISKEDVKLWQQPPFGSKPVGKIIVEVAQQGLADGHQQQLIDYAKEQAAKLGASGVVVEKFGQLGDVLVLEGLAIEL